MQFHSRSFDSTVKYGKKLGRSLRGGEVVVLSGALGSGKTAFTKGIALGIGIRDTVTSPSFSILNEYKGEIDLYHFDFYRIGDSTEMEDLLDLNDQLRVELSTLKSLDRIESIAEDKLGLIKSAKVRFLVLSEGADTEAEGKEKTNIKKNSKISVLR